MSQTAANTLSSIRTMDETVEAFRDEKHCYKHSITFADRNADKRWVRAGLYQCSSREYRFQFTVTTHTPLLRQSHLSPAAFETTREDIRSHIAETSNQMIGGEPHSLQ